jgi:GNAT superfamily N-acetyltransferase
MAASVALRPLTEGDLPQARALLRAALPLCRADLVAREKLLGDNGPRQGGALGAEDARGSLVGLVAWAGRYIKILCVDPAARGRGVGRALLAAARAQAGGRARVCDHPGNYLSPGVDERYEAGRQFLLRHGFREVARVRNLRANVAQNPLVTPERAAALAGAAAQRGYTVRRVLPGDERDVQALLAMVRAAFSPIWALEVARALGVTITGSPDPMAGELGSGVHVAFDRDRAPVAFAAHDGNNRGLGWFGPMGTLPAHRGQGLGEALLIPCLLDVVERPDGGVIAWVGPEGFYARACGAGPDRQFVVYEEG